jgi:glycosyltransferase involved in cell wall biosynthesis
MQEQLLKKMERDVSIDLVVCTYNNAELLDKALDAISKQRVSSQINWRVLVVNNNCTDNTPEIVEKYSRSGKLRLTMISEPQQGVNHARVCGVRNTSGEWIAFIDDDCLLEDEWTEQAALFALDHHFVSDIPRIRCLK